MGELRDLRVEYANDCSSLRLFASQQRSPRAEDGQALKAAHSLYLFCTYSQAFARAERSWRNRKSLKSFRINA